MKTQIEALENFNNNVIEMFTRLVKNETHVMIGWKELITGNSAPAKRVVERQEEDYIFIHKITPHKFYQRERAKAVLGMLRVPGGLTHVQITRKFGLNNRTQILGVISTNLPEHFKEAETLYDNLAKKGKKK